jgi:hypothetical protein
VETTKGNIITLHNYGKDFIYEFEGHPARKGDCPSCGHKGVFRYYLDLPREFGRCERVNSCGYHNKPTGVTTFLQSERPPKPESIIVYPDSDTCRGYVNNRMSPFHRVVENLIENREKAEKHLERWGVGTKADDIQTVFIYINKDKQPVNIKSITYGKDGKRDKEKNPYYLSAGKGEKYLRCLYGSHLLRDKTVILAESEKTAVIASYLYPQFDWLATGGNNGLHDDHIEVLFNKQVIYLRDADKAGKENSTLKKLRDYEINFKILDLFPDRTDGYDIADAILEGQRPEIPVFDHISDAGKMVEDTFSENAEKSETLTKNLVSDGSGFAMTLAYVKRNISPALLLNDTALMHIGEAMTLVSLPGGGKSQTMGAICGAFVGRRLGVEVDGLGFRDETDLSKSILLCDYERPHDQNRDDYQRTYNRLGRPELNGSDTIPFLKYVCYIDVIGKEARMSAFEKEVSTGKYSIVLMDGILGIINSMNDDVECNNTIQWLLSLANKYQFAIVVTMHPNKGTDTMAGHIGGFLYRYSRACLFLKNNEHDKNIKEITDNFSQRKLSYGQEAQTYFAYDDEKKMFVTVSETPEKPTKTTFSSKNFQAVFSKYLIDKGNTEIPSGELKLRYSELISRSPETAKKHIESAVDMGLLIPDGQGKATTYKLNEQMI